LDKEGLFSLNTGPRDITLLISISDDQRSWEVENYSARLLNSKTLADRFLDRFKPK